MTEYQTLKENEKRGWAQFGDDGGYGAGWGAGGFMILLGGVFFLWYSDLPAALGIDNWIVWLLIPAYWVVVGAWSALASGTPDARRKGLTILVFGLLPFAFAAIPALGLNAQLFLPLVFILLGLSMLLRRG